MIKLPYPPTINHYYFTTKQGRRIITAKGKAYHQEVGYLLNSYKPTSDPVKMLINVYPPDNRRRDLDNILKVLGDSMEGYLYKDDNQIVDLHVIKFPKVKGGYIEVHIESTEWKDGNWK